MTHNIICVNGEQNSRQQRKIRINVLFNLYYSQSSSCISFKYVKTSKTVSIYYNLIIRKINIASLFISNKIILYIVTERKRKINVK